MKAANTLWWVDNANVEGGMPFNYNHNEIIGGFSKYVISEAMSFNHNERQTCEYFNKIILQL